MNIKDIARISGYSVTTVSRVINDHPYVSDEKRQRIKKVMQDVGYVPNNTARALSSGRSKNIGIVMPFSNYPYFERIIAGVVESAFEKGYKVTLLPTNYDKKTEEDYFKQLQAKSFDGLIITSKCNDFSMIAHYQTYGPIVCCEETLDYPTSSVSIDRHPALVSALVFLRETGCRRVAVTVSREASESASTRAIIKAYREVYGELPETLFYRDCSIMEDGVAAVQHFMTEQPTIDAIFTNGDEIAAGVVKALETFKRSDIHVMGQGASLTSDILQIPTIDHHLHQIGKEAFRHLFLIEQEKTTLASTFISR
ncbi:LacI family DNA-binding transcriptional regulator [Brochothrix thermosphacta]|uniref:LacI family DNA-binding transcriptional regulator n=1 Tax=Brochothrix thermosphacta TaxID=2756 RepID=UPI001C50202C|nr:LacI family DNA-binding transcriptional regulator [Brochothrix thermosphacta]